MTITNRQKKIIEILLESEESITCQKIAKIINVSDRTVLNEINVINNKLSQDKQIIVARGKGIKVNNKDTIFELHQLYKSSRDDNLVFKFINKLLINKYFNQEIYSADVADELYISLSTLNNLVKEAKIILKEYQLEIVLSNKDGIYLVGDEKNIRFCMSNMLFSSSNDYEKFLNDLGLFKKTEIEEIKKITLELLDKFDFSLTYIAFNSFIIHILISILRNNKIKDYPSSYIKILSETMEQNIIKELIETINLRLGYELEEDFYYLTEHLIASQKFSDDGNLLEDNTLTNEIFSKILKRIKKDFSIDFSNDEIFSKSLKIHLNSSLNRYKINIPIKHIDLSEIKSQYPIAYDMGIVAGEEISSVLKIDIDDTEILFLALHLGTAFNRSNQGQDFNGSSILIICGAGLSTARFLKYSLLENFKDDINKIDIISFNEYIPTMKDDYDLVLNSLQNIDTIDGAIKVNYILTNTELNILKNKLLAINNKDYIKVFDENLFFIKSFNTKDEVLEFITEKLKNEKTLNVQQVKSIYEREEMGNTSLGNGIAIPHPLSYSAKEMKIAVLINENMIDRGDDKVSIILLLLIPREKIKTWDILFKKLFKVFSNNDNVLKLSESKNIYEFTDVLIEEME